MGSNKKDLKAYVRLDSNNNVIAGSNIFRKTVPKNGRWREIVVNTCCVPLPPYPINYNFDFEYTGTEMFDNYGIEDEATFISFLESQRATNIIVTDFQLTPSRLRCNLTFDGITELDLSSFGINKINNLDSLVNLTTLYLGDNQITTIENLDSLVNLTYLDLSYNQITTTQFNILNSWAILAPINGNISTNNNTNNFNTSTTYTTLLGKGWSITL